MKAVIKHPTRLTVAFPTRLIITNTSTQARDTLSRDSSTVFIFPYRSIIFHLFNAVKTILSKLENLWYLRSKKVNFHAQHWLQCIKKVKNNRSIGIKVNCSFRSQWWEMRLLGWFSTTVHLCLDSKSQITCWLVRVDEPFHLDFFHPFALRVYVSPAKNVQSEKNERILY